MWVGKIISDLADSLQIVVQHGNSIISPANENFSRLRLRSFRLSKRSKRNLPRSSWYSHLESGIPEMESSLFVF